MKSIYILLLVVLIGFSQKRLSAQENQTTVQLKVKELIAKKAEYHRITGGESDGYRIKIHFGVDRNIASNIRGKFSSKYNDIKAYEDYQQPNFVVLVGDFKTKLEAFEVLKKIQGDFPSAFIVKSKVRV
ncbi:MAG: SPOR domain-containing protein [Sediminibacterium sp.]|nr:SPOR domain-containing protein [Sediminibacterium sp.]